MLFVFLSHAPTCDSKNQISPWIRQFQLQFSLEGQTLTAFKRPFNVFYKFFENTYYRKKNILSTKWACIKKSRGPSIELIAEILQFQNYSRVWSAKAIIEYRLLHITLCTLNINRGLKTSVKLMPKISVFLSGCTVNGSTKCAVLLAQLKWVSSI